MIVYSAIVPHPAISLPSIGKANLDKVSQTITAFGNIKHELLSRQAETIVFISPHASDVPEAFSINQSKDVQTDLTQFGNLQDSLSLQNDVALAYRIRETVESTQPLMCTENQKLDYATSIVSLQIIPSERKPKIVVVGTATALPIADQIAFGHAIAERIDNSTQRIALIATADLSHHPDHVPSTDFIQFDRQLIEFIEKNKLGSLISLDKRASDFQAGRGLRSVAVLLGLLKNKKIRVATLSYENTTGVGYATIVIEME